MNNAWEVAEREDTPEDPSKRTDKGKSSHASSVESLVTLQEIADRNIMAIKGPNTQTQGPHETTCQQYTPGRPVKTQVESLEA
jgi:hypothetical protein